MRKEKAFLAKLYLLFMLMDYVARFILIMVTMYLLFNYVLVDKTVIENDKRPTIKMSGATYKINDNVITLFGKDTIYVLEINGVKK